MRNFIAKHSRSVNKAARHADRRRKVGRHAKHKFSN